MSDVFVTNTSGGATITGSPTDRLVVTYNVAGDVITSGFAGSLAAGYSGLFGGPAANDISFSGFGSFTFTNTGNGIDNITTGDGNDVFATGANNDVIHSGAGIDVVDGGGDNDLWGADMSFATDDIVINLERLLDFLGTGSVVNVEGFGGLTTGLGNDQLTSTAAALTETSIPAPATTPSHCRSRPAKRWRAAPATTGWS